MNIIAMVLVGSLGSPVRQNDLDDTGPLKRARRLHLFAGVAVCAALVVGSSMIAGTADAVSLLRNLAAAAGVSLISFALLGQGLYWVLPFFALVSLMFSSGFGTDAIEWNWLYARESSVFTWVLAAILLVAGISIFLLKEEGRIRIGLVRRSD